MSSKFVVTNPNSRISVPIEKSDRNTMNEHRSGVVWFTGLSASGKTTISTLAERQLHCLGVRTYLLDGDKVRQGLTSDLGFTPEDRIENVRRIAQVARLMADAGLLVLVAVISPFAEERATARCLVAPGEFCEVYVDVPIHIAEARDPKGLYRKARQGQLPNFTGIDSPYEPPENAELHLRSNLLTPDSAADRVMNWLKANWDIPEFPKQP